MASLPANCRGQPSGAKGNSIRPSSVHRSTQAAMFLSSSSRRLWRNRSAGGVGTGMGTLHPVIRTGGPEVNDTDPRSGSQTGSRMTERRPRKDAVRNRTAVLAAADALFNHRESPEDLTMAAIAAAAGVGKATLFRA